MTDVFDVPKAISLPQTAIILAMSADGKISDHRRSPARFGSPSDQAHLEERVAWADVVLFGAGTLRAYGTTMSVRSPQLLAQRQARGQSPQPVQVVCSASGNINSSARFFQQPVPRWLLTTEQGMQFWKKMERKAGQNIEAFEKVWVAPQMLLCEDQDRCGDSGARNKGPQETSRTEGYSSPAHNWPVSRIDWLAVWRSLAQSGFERVAVLGGGTLAAAVFEADLVQELWLTLCPLVLGGRNAPTPVDGDGFLAKAAPKLQLQAVRQQGDEVFLQYNVLTKSLVSTDESHDSP